MSSAKLLSLARAVSKNCKSRGKNPNQFRIYLIQNNTFSKNAIAFNRLTASALLKAEPNASLSTVRFSSNGGHGSSEFGQSAMIGTLAVAITIGVLVGVKTNIFFHLLTQTFIN
jgi:hypothetical protein